MAEQHVVIQTRLGGLRGYTRQSVLSDKTYYAFQGIPYAKPPLGKLRFKAPEPFGGWKGTRDALKDGNDPKQAVLLPKPGMNPDEFAEGDEDCLYINVFANKLPVENSTKKPVIFSVHGGGFAGGSGNINYAGPDFLLDGDVVVVTFNYRCGAFGFLSLENEVVPGNAGLKDQVLALKWVRDNIDSFGGDTNNVTIRGGSAGGASVHYLLLSPLSKGLFHQAIIQSGFSSNPWAFQPKPRTIAVELAKTIGCLSDDNDEILKFLQSVPADDIVRATKTISKDKDFLKNISLIFTPCVEVSNAAPFLIETPTNVMRKGEFHKVPVILGAALNEGSVVVFFDGINENEFSRINEKPELLVPFFLGITSGSTEEKEVTKDIWNYYLKGKPLSWETVNEYLMYYSDIQFNLGMAEARSSLLEKSSSPVYTYVFTNHSKCICSMFQSMYPEKYSKLKATSESCHGADLMFLYATNIMPLSLTPDYEAAIKRHVKVWTTFASIGDPNCKDLKMKWERDSMGNPCFMDIGTTWTMKDGVPFAERIDFWNNLRSKYCTAYQP